MTTSVPSGNWTCRSGSSGRIIMSPYPLLKGTVQHPVFPPKNEHGSIQLQQSSKSLRSILTTKENVLIRELMVVIGRQLFKKQLVQLVLVPHRRDRPLRIGDPPVDAC